MVANAGLVSESEGVEPHRHVVVLPVDDVEDEVEEAEEGAELEVVESAETVDSPADAVEEA